MRQNGLIRVVFALPANIRLIDPATNAPSDEQTVDVWRMVPGVTDVKLTGADGLNPWPRGPNQTGGFQLDGRFLTLQEQALGALISHAQIKASPRQRLLDDLTSFQRVLFTNERVRALSDAIDNGVIPLSDADPPLNALEQQGKGVFMRACAQCHGGPGNRRRKHRSFACTISSRNVRGPWTLDPRCRLARALQFRCVPATACAQRADLRNHAAQWLDHPADQLDPGRALLTGVAIPAVPTVRDDWNKLDVPGIRGMRHTAPYFHNNSAGTLEELVDHYIEFFKFVE